MCVCVGVQGESTASPTAPESPGRTIRMGARLDALSSPIVTHRTVFSFAGGPKAGASPVDSAAATAATAAPRRSGGSGSGGGAASRSPRRPSSPTGAAASTRSPRLPASTVRSPRLPAGSPAAATASKTPADGRRMFPSALGCDGTPPTAALAKMSGSARRRRVRSEPAVPVFTAAGQLLCNTSPRRPQPPTDHLSASMPAGEPKKRSPFRVRTRRMSVCTSHVCVLVCMRVCVCVHVRRTCVSAYLSPSASVCLSLHLGVRHRASRC